MIRRQTDSIEPIRNEIPVGVDPFEYLLQSLHTLMFPDITNGALSVLMFFLALHMVITLSCLTCLLVSLSPILRHQGRENQWIWKRLYIKDDFGHKAHPTPLYLLNTGVFLSLAQLFGSIGAQVYIWTEYRSSKSPDFAMHARIAPSLGWMFMFEFYASWLMIWCFLVTLLYTQKSYAEKLKCSPHTTMSPFVINFLLISFPVCATIANMTAISFLTSARITHNENWQGFEIGLKRGSMLWQQLNLIPSSDFSEGKYEIMKELAQIKVEDQVWSRKMKDSLEHLIHRFRISQVLWGAVLSPTCLVFIITFWKLIKQLNPKIDSLHNASTRIFSFFVNMYSSSAHETTNRGSQSTSVGKRGFFSPHQQFLYLVFRALAMVLGILLTINLLLIGAIKSTEIIIDPTWRSTAMWLAVFSGTCSAIPVMFQCWRLYADPGVIPTESGLRYETTEAAEMDVFKPENDQLGFLHSPGDGKPENRSDLTHDHSVNESRVIGELETSNLLHILWDPAFRPHEERACDEGYIHISPPAIPSSV